MTRALLEKSLRFIERAIVYNTQQTKNKHTLIAELKQELARPAIPDDLSNQVDAWFATNTGLGGCSDKDISELMKIFYGDTHLPLTQQERKPLHTEDEVQQILDALNYVQDNVSFGVFETHVRRILGVPAP